MTSEIELKLQIPASQRTAVQARLLHGSCTRQPLHALYYDTPGGDLSRAAVALRLRRQGRQWVQTLKCADESPVSRREHEVGRGTGREVPALDLSLHAGTSGHQQLLAAGGQQLDSLAPVFEVRVQRLSRLVRHRGALIELALDQGHIICGRSRSAISELELELKTGSLAALASLAARWVRRYGLWLDVRSKAERGFLLARQQAALPASPGHVPALTARLSPDAALRGMTRATLLHILPNASALAADAGDAEHVHQVRIGLRRLLSVWRVFSDGSADLQPDWRKRTAALFKLLGQVRDRDALAQWPMPQLQATGAPACDLGAPIEGLPPAQVFRSKEATLLLLELLTYSHTDAVRSSPSGAKSSVLALGVPRLRRLHRKLQQAGKMYASLNDAQRHRARKQLKRLRYGAEMVSALWSKRAWRAYDQRLQHAQDRLGRVQDLVVAKAAFSRRRGEDPGALLAREWLAKRQARWVRRAGRALKGLGKLPKFLR